MNLCVHTITFTREKKTENYIEKKISARTKMQ